MASISLGDVTAEMQGVALLPGMGETGQVNKPPLPPTGKSIPLSALQSNPFAGKSSVSLGDVAAESSTHFLKRAGKDLAGLADMLLSTPGGLLSTLAGKAYETFTSLPLSKAEAERQTAEGASIRKSVTEYTTSPIAHIMHAMGYKKDYSDADVGKVTKLINEALTKGSTHVAAASHGTVSPQQLQVLAGDLINLAPLGFSRFALLERAKLSPEELRSGKVGNQTAEDILNRYTEQTGNPDNLTPHDVARKMEQTLTEKSDAEIHAEAKAYDLMKRGASLKEVLAARKNNPLVGEKLDEFMAKRREHSQTIQGDKDQPFAESEAKQHFDEAAAKGEHAHNLRQSARKAYLQDQKDFKRAGVEARYGKPFEASPKTRLSEGKVLGEEPLQGGPLPKPSALERAQAKIAAGRKFDLTAEEKIAWNKAPVPDLTGIKKGPATGTESPGGQSPMGGASTPPRPELPGSRPLLAGPEPAAPASRLPGGRQSGSVDMRTLLPVAAAATGAVVGAHLAEQEKLEGAILGGLGGLAAAMAPRYAARVGDQWGRALKTGVVTAGVAYGMSRLDKDHPIEGAVLGSLWGATHLLPKAKVPMVGAMSIDDLVNARNGAIAAQGREVVNTSWAMRTAVPDPARRAAVAEAVEKGSTRGLSPQEVKVYNAYKGFTRSFGEAAKDQGVLKDLVQNYVTHVVEREAQPLTKVQEVMDALFGGGERAMGGASPVTGFAKHRAYSTFAELEKALQGTGLKVKTKDIADLVDIYGQSMARAVENKRLFDNLKAAKEGGEGGVPFILPADKAPQSYETVVTPQLQGMKVHPDMAPALKFVAESYRPGYVTRGILGLSLAQKRLSTGMSLFHAQNLINAYVGASGLRSAKMLGDVNAALKTYREGGLGDVIDTGLRNGLRVERPMETDLAAGKKLGAAIDGLVNGTLGIKFSAFEKGMGAIESVQRETFDKLTWDYLHTGLKLALYTREFEKGLRDHPTWSKDEVARQVSSFVNDTFGGLDWYRVASETQTAIGRNIAMHLLSPKGRGALQILMFAPDWTLSTFRAMYKALPGSTAMPLTHNLHMKYVMRTALIWATLMNGYNLMASGHPIWDNKDPTKIEWRDGTTQQIAKHAMEGPEWLLNPRQTALNKLGVAIKEPLTQLLGVEYLSAEGKAPPMKSRMGHLAGAVLPLSVQTGAAPGRSLGETTKRAALSTLGMPVYRMSKAEREAAKAKSRYEHRRKRRGE